ncbi:MAG: CpaF family protein [Eubacterium sp.]|nr:CpaF family protein [Eubacterium sp.]
MKVDNIEEIRNQVIEMIDMTHETDEQELHDIIDQQIVENYNINQLSINERYNIHREIYNSIRGLGVVEELLKDESITEIMINGTKNIFIERDGEISQIDHNYSSPTRLNDVIQQIVGKTNKRVNQANPIVDTRLEDGSRVNVVLPPISLSGAVVTIRKFPSETIDMDKLIKWKSITKEAADFLRTLVRAGYNIFVSGGTGSGKTTFLNALSNFVEEDERVITIEDSAELQLKNIKNLISLETRSSTDEGTTEISIRDLIRTSLRMRPDRVIVGEVRGPEALDMLQAMNTGHDGSMSTGHANSPKDMLARLETMVLMGIDMPLLAIRSQIASGIDIIIHLGRLHDKSRKVLEIDEVDSINNGEIVLRKLFELKKKGNEFELTKITDKLLHREKLISYEG